MTFLELVRAKSTALLNSTFLEHLESPFAGGVSITVTDMVVGIVADQTDLSGTVEDGGFIGALTENPALIGIVSDDETTGTISNDVTQGEIQC